VRCFDVPFVSRERIDSGNPRLPLFRNLFRIGSMNGVKEAGLLRSEGKDYVMQDGDIVVFRFNV